MRLKVQPQSSSTEIIGVDGEAPPRLKLRVTAPPVDGKANQEVLKFLKKQLRVTAAQLQVVRGETSTEKDVLCEGLTLEAIKQRLLP